MKWLFDEPVPRPFGAVFPRDFDISTAQEMNWAGIGNGELLRLAAAHDFDAMLTLDQNMRHPIGAPPLPVVAVASAQRMNALESLLPRILEILRGDLPNKFHLITPRAPSPPQSSRGAR